MTQSTVQIPQTLDSLAKLCPQEASALGDATTGHVFTLELHLNLSTQKIFQDPDSGFHPHWKRGRGGVRGGGGSEGGGLDPGGTSSFHFFLF